jgi:hypothetical protein
MLLTYQETSDLIGPKSNASIVEDLRDFIENVSAVDRPALALLRKSRVRTTYVEWLEDVLPARAHDAWDEGIAHTDISLATPTRSTATVQTFAKFGQVSDTQRNVEHAGLNDMFLYQEQKKVAEALNDMEHAIHRGSVVTGASGTARQMAGFLNVITTNATDSSGTTFTEEVFNDLVQLFVDGGTEIRPSVCFVNSYGKRTISLYSTQVTRNIQASDAMQKLIVEAHESDFGRVNIHYSRDQLNPANKTSQGMSCTIIDPDFFELGFLQSLRSEVLARDGLRTRFQVSSQMTLVYRTEKGGAVGTSYVPYIASGTIS